MTNDNHPITPPDELVDQWKSKYWSKGFGPTGSAVGCQRYIGAQAAQWGYEQRGAANEAELQKARDEELEACCDWLDFNYPHVSITMLRAARRPKPKSLKEQALQVLANADGADHPVVTTVLTADQHLLIRRALEQLDD